MLKNSDANNVCTDDDATTELDLDTVCVELLEFLTFRAGGVMSSPVVNIRVPPWPTGCDLKKEEIVDIIQLFPNIYLFCSK